MIGFLVLLVDVLLRRRRGRAIDRRRMPDTVTVTFADNLFDDQPRTDRARQIVAKSGSR